MRRATETSLQLFNRPIKRKGCGLEAEVFERAKLFHDQERTALETETLLKWEQFRSFCFEDDILLCFSCRSRYFYVCDKFTLKLTFFITRCYSCATVMQS